MERRSMLNPTTFQDDGTWVELKVRELEFAFQNAFLFPTAMVRRTVETIEDSGLLCEAVPVDVYIRRGMEYKVSRFWKEGMSSEEGTVIYTAIDIDDLCDVVEYVEAHPEEQIKVTYHLVSELPEFSEVLNKEKTEQLPPEIRFALREYMYFLLNDYRHFGGRAVNYIYSEEDNSKFVKLLPYYTDAARQFLADHMSSRARTELERQMNNGEDHDA